MATRHEIKCINKTDRYDPHDRIKAIGGVNYDGTNWKMPQQDAVQAIKAGKYSFFVQVLGRQVDVTVAISRFGHEYIKTVADGKKWRVASPPYLSHSILPNPGKLWAQFEIEEIKPEPFECWAIAYAQSDVAASELKLQCSYTYKRDAEYHLSALAERYPKTARIVHMREVEK